jgi:cysteine desulfurase
LIDGGGHEHGLRSGTLATPLVVGLGAACRIARAERAAEAERLFILRDRLHHGIARCIDRVSLNGHPIDRLPGNLNLSFAGVKGEALMMQMKQLAVSSGSACTSAKLGPSYVLLALGLSEEEADCSLRFGLGRFTTEAEIDFAIEHVVNGVRNLRSMSI